MAKHIVKHGSVKVGEKLYAAGEEVELTDEQALSLAGALGSPEKPATLKAVEARKLAEAAKSAAKSAAGKPAK